MLEASSSVILPYHTEREWKEEGKRETKKREEDTQRDLDDACSFVFLRLGLVGVSRWAVGRSGYRK